MFCEFHLSKNEKDARTESVLGLVHRKCSINVWRGDLSPALVSPPQTIGLPLSLVTYQGLPMGPISHPPSLSRLREPQPVLVLDSPTRRRNWFKVKHDEIQSDVRKDLPHWLKPRSGELGREQGRRAGFLGQEPV